MRAAARGLTLVELVIIIVVTGIIALITPSLLLHGVRVFVFLPNALVVNQAAAEVMHQIVEGGFSDVTITGQSLVRGLRFAVRRSTSEPALWLVQANRIGFLTSDGQYVIVRLDTAGGDLIKRSVLAAPATCSTIPPSPAEESIPYDAAGSVRIITAGSLFVYYDSSGNPVTPLLTGCPPATTVRRVDVAFIAQTGGGNFDQGDAQETMTSSVAIRVP